MDRFTYSIIRFVPDPARGEFVNVGAIVGSDDAKEWTLHTIDNLKRARALDDQDVLPRVFSFLNNIGKKFDSFNESWESLFPLDVEISEEWLHHLYERSENVIQLTPPAPVAATDLDAAVLEVVNTFVVDPESRRKQRTTKHSVLAKLRRAYVKSGLSIGDKVIEKAGITSDRYSGVFDFAVANGSVVQVAQAWSFQVADKDALIESVKAWAWTVRDLRKDGGVLHRGDTDIVVPPDVTVDVVYVPPADGERRDALQQARTAFGEIDANLYELEAAESVAQQAVALLGGAGSGDWHFPALR